MFFIEEKKTITPRFLVYAEPKLRKLSINYVWKQWIWSVLPSVCWFKTVRLLVNILIYTSWLCRNGSFSQITCFDRLQTYMMANVLQWIYVTLSRKKQTDFKPECLMFLDLASCMKLLYFTSEQYLHKAERAFPYSVSILKSFVNGHFLKVVINMVSF